MNNLKLIITILIIAQLNCIEKDRKQNTSLCDFFIKDQGCYRYTYVNVDNNSGADSMNENIEVTYELNGVRKISSEREIKFNDTVVQSTYETFCLPKIKNKVFSTIEGKAPYLVGEIIVNKPIKMYSTLLSFSHPSTPGKRNKITRIRTEIKRNRVKIKGKVTNVFDKKAFGEERKVCNLQFLHDKALTKIQLMEGIGETEFFLEVENNGIKDTLWNIKLISIKECENI